jgi:ADP-ribose pyrophosphatase
MKNLEEKQKEREILYEGPFINFVKDTVILPNGKAAVRVFGMHVGAVAVLAVTDEGKILMERQYRHPHGRVFFEIPAGKLDSKDEDIFEAAKRELREETGAVAKKMTYLGHLAPSPAVLDERIALFLAEGLSFGERELDEDEFLNVEEVDPITLTELVMKGEIEDAKTQIAILKYNMLKKT